ncbi:tyrosine-type recombinase/integrase [Candidatus Dojkabacteria bacterium]|nr:tyrosine-type recombinase/integrase [Candidatus Dojkabacteria bacterium]
MLLSCYKLPNQDEFLLDLQNNNYSKRTVYSYGRDLSIIARFFMHNDIDYKMVDKRCLTLYKGYLRNGDHLKIHEKDKQVLNEIIKKLIRDKQKSDENLADAPNTSTNADTKPLTSMTSSKGSKTNENDIDAYQAVLERLKNDQISAAEALGISVRSTGNISENGLGSRSVNRMLSAFRSYLKWCIDFDIAVPIPPEAIKLIKTERKKVQVPEMKELVSLIEFPSKYEKDHRVAARNRAMLELLFSTGMRISELINLNMEQINNDGKIFIMGKGKKERFVYLTPRATNYLNEYLKVRGDAPKDHDDKEFNNSQSVSDINSVLKDDENVAAEGLSEDSQNKVGDSPLSYSVSDEQGLDALLSASKKRGEAVFIPYRGGRDGTVGKRLSTNFLQEKIAEYRRILGIVVPLSAHSLRHGFATYLAENGANPVAIQILLGHESLQTTTRYVHASDRYAETTHRKRHPLKDS